MNTNETGKAIASLRKKAGYTQAALAEILEVSDKAVSKWERGIACPDISLLPKLSILLDTDIEGLFNGIIIPRASKWKGILVLDKIANEKVYSKPMVYLLLQNFLLVGIRDILIIGDEKTERLLGNGENLGVTFTFSHRSIADSLLTHKSYLASSTMVVYGNVLIYGANLTRKYQAMMLYNSESIIMKTDNGLRVPILFCPENVWATQRDKVILWKNADDIVRDIKPIEKPFTRGIIALPMNNADEIMTASHFVQIIEQSENREMANLEEIARSRGLLKEKR